MILEKLIEELEKHQISFANEYVLKNSSTFRIGGKCALAVFPKDEDSLVTSISLLDGYGIPFHIVGRGSNTLFFDGYIDKALVFTAGVNQIHVYGTKIECGVGVGLVALCAKACELGLCGLEFACGIPGSIGGAVFMNAGAHGGSMQDLVISTRAYDRKNKTIVTVTEHSFGYRDSIYKKDTNLVCLGAKLLLGEGKTEQIRAKMREMLEQRRSKQPVEYPSAGSYFKRPEGDFAGRLIEISGLKGARVGDAEVSEKHAGFIINKGNATFDDVLALEAIVVDTVYKNSGVLLDREVEIVK